MRQDRFGKKMIAWVAVIATLVVVLFSTGYLCENMEHDCMGEHCDVCATVLQCSNNLKTISTTIIAMGVVVVLFEISKESVMMCADAVSCNSLISQKVRLNN